MRPARLVVKEVGKGQSKRRVRKKKLSRGSAQVGWFVFSQSVSLNEKMQMQLMHRAPTTSEFRGRRR